MNQKQDISRRRFLPAGVVAAGAAANPGVRQIEWIAGGPQVSLMAGRCISATHLGAAAGKVSELQARLRADGVSFDVLDRDQKNL